jgi:hypothetical protein
VIPPVIEMSPLPAQTERHGLYQPSPARMDYVVAYLRARALELRNLAITTRDARASQELHQLAHLCEEKAVVLDRRERVPTAPAGADKALRAKLTLPAPR